jgi:putative transposase
MFGRGGWRKGAGRKPGPRPGVQHRRRPIHRAVNPVNLTLRARTGLPSLRSPALFRVVRDCIKASSGEGFRVVVFSVQGDHVHLLVEADDHSRLGSGVRGLSIRTALAVNRTLGRKGRFWGDRYHARDLATPREVRNALIYVLRNRQKHRPGTSSRPDPCSSASWFDGFVDHTPSSDPSPVRPARTWLAAVGWRRTSGPIHPHEIPRPAPPQRHP